MPALKSTKNIIKTRNSSKQQKRKTPTTIVTNRHLKQQKNKMAVFHIAHAQINYSKLKNNIRMLETSNHRLNPIDLFMHYYIDVSLCSESLKKSRL